MKGKLLAFKRARLVCYRIRRLEKGVHRCGTEIPLGFRYIFTTEPHATWLLIRTLRLEQSQNPQGRLENWVRRAQFYQRWIDPIILPGLRRILGLWNRLSAFQDLWCEPPEHTVYQLEVRRQKVRMESPLDHCASPNALGTSPREKTAGV